MNRNLLHYAIVEQVNAKECTILFDKFKCDTSTTLAKKLWQRWHYRDGRPKPNIVRHRCERKELDKANKNLEAAMCDVIDLRSANHKLERSLKEAHGKLIDYVAKVSNYQTEVHTKNLQIINLQCEVSKAHNTTKIVAVISVVIILALILIPYFE